MDSNGRQVSGWLMLLLNGLLSVVYAQPSPRTRPVVANVRVETTMQQVVIRYDVSGLSAQDSVYVQVIGRTRGPLRVRRLSGDAGTGLTAGVNKIVVWDYLRDGETLDDEIQAIVNIKHGLPVATIRKDGGSPGQPAGVRPNLGGGPANALLSALLPGLGNAMVQSDRRIRFQPVIAVAYVGALAYGLSQKSKSNAKYNQYVSQPYDQLAQPYYEEANRLHHRYVLATGAAALIWATDVTYTLLKGLKNERLRKAGAIGMRPVFNYIGQTPAIGFRAMVR